MLDPSYIHPIAKVEKLNVDYLMGYPLEFTGIYKTQMNVELGGVSLILYYNLVNMVVDLLGNFGFYGSTSYEYFCKSENMYCFSLSDVSVILPNTPNNVVNDVSLTDQYDQLHLDVSSAYVEVNAPVSHYKGNGCYSFNIVLGQHLSTDGTLPSLSDIAENYPILLSFKPHQLDPVGQIRNGQNTTHSTPFCGCESITLNGEYWYNGVISDDCQDSLYLTLNALFPRMVLYPEVIPAVMVLCDNILGVNLYTVTEKQFQEMQNSNRFVFYHKYFDDFRETKRNIVNARFRPDL